jgi:hypothetical protein
VSNTPLETSPESQDSSESSPIEVLRKGWLTHALSVQCPEGVYLVKYAGWGLGYECVLVNGVEVARLGGKLSGGRKTRFSMSARFEILLGRRPAVFTIYIPWWKVLLLLPWISHVQLELEDRVVYKKGRPPGKPPQTIVMCCRKCRYDIRVSILDEKETCPECGTALPITVATSSPS